jgi:hypothetical protein
MESTGQSDPRGVLEGHAPAEDYDIPEEERELASDLMTRFNESLRARNFWETDANFFRNFLVGNQLVLRAQSTNEVLRISVVGENSRRLHSIDNILRPTARALLGKLTRIIPSVQVQPATTDQAELRAALVADTFIDHMTNQLKLRTKYLGACRHLTWAGTAFLQVVWNKAGGREIAWCKECKYTGEADEIGGDCPRCALENEAEADAKNQEIMVRQQALQQQAAMQGGLGPETQMPPEPVQPAAPPELKRVMEGDIEVRLHDPRDVYPEPGVSNIEDMRWFCVRKARHISKLRREYPKFAKYMHSETGLYTDRAIGFYGHSYNSRAEVQDLEDHAWEYEFTEVPSAKYPEGRVIKMVNDMIVDHTFNPAHMLGRVPLFVFRFEKNDGEFWGESFVAQAWHIQKERNKLMTQLRTHRELTNNPQKLVPMQARISQTEWDDQPGRVITYNPIGGKPDYVSLPAFPAYVYSELDRMRIAIQEKAGVTDQEMGRGGGDTSGRFAAIQEAQASESIAPIMVDNNEEWTELHRAILMFAQQYYSDDRFWTVTGRDRMMTHTFKELNLSPGWDVYLADEDSLSRNPALRLQDAERLLQLGVFTDAQTGVPDMRAFKRAAGLKLPGVGPDLDGGERSYAAEIPRLIKEGKGFQPAPWDDALIIVEELLGWLRGPGRHEDQDVVAQVGQIWMMYMQELVETGRADPKLTMSQAGMGQPAGQQNPGNMAIGGQPGPRQPQNTDSDAAQITQQADQAAEGVARAGQPHESGV